MSAAREEVLGRIRAALRGAPPAGEPAPAPEYRQAAGEPREEILSLFVERAGDYRSEVRRAEPEAVREAVGEILRGRGVRRLAVPPGLPAGWVPEGVEVVSEEAGPIDNAALDACDGVLTGCAVAIAQTGTLVLDGGPGQGRRALTLLPDYHLCVVLAEQVVGLVPEAITRLAPVVRDERRPLTFVSGPSATSDIELNRVEGVHGPRTLDILVVG